MAEELPDDRIQDNGPGPGPALPPERLKELGGILVKMRAQHAGPDRIKNFVSGYTKLYGSMAPPSPQQVGTAPPSQDEQNPLVQLQKSADDSKASLDQESAGNDDAIAHLIYQGRVASQQGAPTSEAVTGIPHIAQPYQAQPISPEEMAATRQSVETNDISRRAHLAAVAKLHPEKAAAIQSAQYLVDRQDELADDPDAADRAAKVLANANRIQKGQLQYNVGTGGQVKKPESTFDSLLSGINSKNQLFDDYQKFKNSSDAQIIDKLETEKKNFDPEQPVASPRGIAGTFASMLGSTPIKSMIAGYLTSAAGAPEAAPWIAGVVGSADYYQMSYASTLRNTYYELREQGVEPGPALDRAKAEAVKEGLTDAASGAVMSMAGAKVGFKEGPALNLSEGFKTAATSVLKKSSNFMTTQGLEGGVVGLTQGLAQYAKNKEAQAAGLKRDDFQDVGEQAVSGALFTIGLASLTKLGGEITGKAYKQFLQGASKVPDDVVTQKLGELVLDKQITPAEAEATKTAIAAHRAIDQTIPDDVTEESRMKIQSRIERRSELEKELETRDPAYHPEIKEKIKAVNEQILALSQDKNKPNAVQEQEPTTNDVRDASDDSQAVGGRNEKERAVDQGAPGQGPGAGQTKPDHVLEARHGTTEHDEQGIASGQNQMGLSDDGVVAAHELKDEVQDNHQLDKIVTSKLQRSIQTGEIVADGKIPVEQREGLNSMDLKDFNGMKDTELKKVMEWYGDHPDATKYEGPIAEHQGKELGESINAYAKRAIEAREAVEKEGPGTMVISHSNNMGIWESYKANGNKWDATAIKDWLSRETPEPAELVRTPEEHAAEAHIADNVEAGDEPTINRAKLFVKDEAEKYLTPEQVHALHGAEAGSRDPDAAPRQLSKGPSAPKSVPSNDQGGTAANQSAGGQPVSSTPSAPDPVGLTRAAKQLLLADRTDDQVLSYLQRKGLNPSEALAALGEAKANPISPEIREEAIAQVSKRAFQRLDDWLGEKEVYKVSSKQGARNLQDDIKAATPKGQNWKDIDKAMHIYLDTERNGQHFMQYYDKLSPEQQRIADLSKKLTPAQLKIAEGIRTSYDAIGAFAKREGLIKDALDNYVARAWDLKNGKPATEENFKFNTSSKHQLQRTLDTILQGQAEGMKLKIEGASNNLQVLQQEVGGLLENKRLLEDGLKLKYDSGETNERGKAVMKPLFTTKSDEPGFKRIDSRAFRKWQHAGKLADYSAEEQKMFGRDTMVTEEGDVMQKRDVYAPEAVAKSLNNILGSGKLDAIKGVLRFNAAVKQSILSFSGFHFLAFTRAHILSAKFATPAEVSPRVAFKTGLKMLAEQDDIVRHLIRKGGLTIGRQQDWVEAVDGHTSWVGRQLDKLAATKAIKDKVVGLNTAMHHYLFDTYGAGLKTFDAVNLYKSELAKNQTADPDALAARVGKLMNDTYGGINWDRMHGTRMQDKTMRQISSLMLLAPDWTSSNLRMAMKSIAKGDEGTLYRKAWGRVILRGAALTTAANAIMAVWDDTDDDGNQLSWPDAMARRYSKAYDIGRLRSTMIDITPLYHVIGGDETKRAYFSVFGAYTDPIKMLTSFGDFVESKGSFLSKASDELKSGENWQHKEFTTLDEVLGMDDKGTYAKTTTEHAAGDISPTTGKPYLRDQQGHDEGDEKGGKLTGQLTKWPQGVHGGVTKGQLPSYILNQVRGLMPTGIQNVWQIASGEQDATTGILNAVGSGVLTDKEPKPKE